MREQYRDTAGRTEAVPAEVPDAQPETVPRARGPGARAFATRAGLARSLLPGPAYPRPGGRSDPGCFPLPRRRS